MARGTLVDHPQDAASVTPSKLRAIGRSKHGSRPDQRGAGRGRHLHRRLTTARAARNNNAAAPRYTTAPATRRDSCWPLRHPSPPMLDHPSGMANKGAACQPTVFMTPPPPCGTRQEPRRTGTRNARVIGLLQNRTRSSPATGSVCWSQPHQRHKPCAHQQAGRLNQDPTSGTGPDQLSASQPGQQDAHCARQLDEDRRAQPRRPNL